MELKIPTPRNFSFRRTAASHGWYQLPPFALDTKKWQLTRVIDLGKQPPVTVFMTGLKSHIRIAPARSLSKPEAATVLRDCRHVLRLDDDLRDFYLATSNDPAFAWFEDLVKMICTTNCSWALTLKMVNGLVDNVGRETGDGRRSFPNAEALTTMPLKFFVDEMRSGYRAPYFKELAERVASGELNVEEWLTSELPTAELAKQIKGVKGVGPYAAENLLKLLGRYDGLALDSWTRAKFFEIRNNGRKANDKKIARYYSRFNEWRGLALWCDVTRDWL